MRAWRPTVFARGRLEPRGNLFSWILPAFLLAAAGPSYSETFSFDLRYSPRLENLSLYDLCVLDPYAPVDLAPAHRMGHKVVAYLSVGEIAPDAWYLDEALATASILGTNPDWGSLIVDVRDPSWADFVIHRLAKFALDKGYDGLFLDTVDVIYDLAEEHPDEAEAFYAGMAGLINGLKATYPGKTIITNRGFEIYDAIKEAIDGFLVESMFQTVGDWFEEQDPETTYWLNRRLEPVKQGGTPIYVLDYCDPSETALAWETAEKIRNLGFNALVMAWLDGNVLATLSAGDTRPPPAQAPVIVSSPHSATIPAGRSVLFSVEATGLNLLYQWRWKGVDIPGATKASLFLNGVKMTWGGPYSVQVRNAAGAATSPPAVLTVTRKKTRR